MLTKDQEYIVAGVKLDSINGTEIKLTKHGEPVKTIRNEDKIEVNLTTPAVTISLTENPDYVNMLSPK